MSVTDNRLVEGAEADQLLGAASEAFEHIGLQLAAVFDDWKRHGAADEELAWCVYLLAFTGWWSGQLQAAADFSPR
ncbi:MAG TPA: hypothetical protein VM142_12665 [Acidimicrobiales bacterium]|nr:hypothetical protein [Acidimicrobiales bacterium]